MQGENLQTADMLHLSEHKHALSSKGSHDSQVCEDSWADLYKKERNGFQRLCVDSIIGHDFSLNCKQEGMRLKVATF